MLKQIITTITILVSFTLNAQWGTLNFQTLNNSFSTNDTVRVQMSVNNFTNLVAYQICVKFKTSGLSFIGIEIPSNNPLGITTSHFGTTQLSQGLIRHLWNNTTGYTLANGTHLYTYVFKALKNSTVQQELSLNYYSNPPMYPVSYQYINNWGWLTLSFITPPTQESLVGVDNIKQNDIRIFPNPCSDVIYVDSTEPVEVFVINSVGDVFYSGTVYSVDQPIPIDNGVNLIRIVTQDKTITRQVIKL